MRDVIKTMSNEDVVLMLPPERPTIHSLGMLQVWCRQYGINFGELQMA